MRCPLVSKMLVLQHICGLDFSAGAASAGLVSIYSCPQLGAACWAQLQSSSWKPHSVDLTGAAPAGCHPAGVYTTGGQAAGSSAAAQQEGYTFYLRPDDSSQASVRALEVRTGARWRNGGLSVPHPACYAAACMCEGQTLPAWHWEGTDGAAFPCCHQAPPHCRCCCYCHSTAAAEADRSGQQPGIPSRVPGRQPSAPLRQLLHQPAAAAGSSCGAWAAVQQRHRAADGFWGWGGGAGGSGRPRHGRRSWK
jgi:hypothetical protein